MLRKMIFLSIFLSLAVPFVIGARVPKAPAELSAAQIADKNVQARGGLQAWRAVQTISYSGKMEVGGKQNAELPFLIQLKRPHKSRVEQQFQGDTGIQVYDGANGWKLRPYLNRMDVEPYTADEVKVASKQSELDGLLVDYAAKGTRIESEGTEKVEDRDTYKLKLTLKNGDVTHVWVDAQTFLETKVQGQPRRLDGTDHPVEVYYRDYRVVDGLKIPFVLETRVLPVTRTAMGLRDTPVPPEKVVIEKVAINPKFDAGLFAKPAPTEAAASKG